MPPHLGHSVASAAGDQIIASLGIWAHDLLPGILNVNEVAADVATDNLDFVLKHRALEAGSMDAALINSKGFGGNNASASILSPGVTRAMLAKRHGSAAMTGHAQRNEAVLEQQAEYNNACAEGENRTIYRFDHNVMGDADIKLEQTRAQLNNASPEIDLQIPNPYSDMCD